MLRSIKNTSFDSVLRLTIENVGPILQIAKATNNTMLTDTCLSKLVLNIDGQITKAIFREHLTADDVDRLLDSDAMRYWGGNIQFQAVALWIDTGEKEAEGRTNSLHHLLTKIEFRLIGSERCLEYLQSKSRIVNHERCR